MATPRKRHSEFGPKVNGPALGRPARGSNYAREVAARVKAVKDRLDSQAKTDDPTLGLTRRSFGGRIGLSHDDAQAEEALRLRFREQSPTLFSAEELSRICDEFGVRAEYLLLGYGPMLVTDMADASFSAPVPYSWSLRERLIRVAASSMDQEEGWVSAYLPDADTLLVAVEQGVVAGLAANIGDRVRDRRMANAAVRQAVADRVRERADVPEATHDFFKSATVGVVAGTVIDLGRTREAGVREGPPTEA